MSLIPIDIDYILPDNDQREEIENLSSLGFSLKEIWMHFGGWNKEEFMHDASTPGCIIHHHIQNGMLMRKQERMLKLQESARNGSVTADQQLQKLLETQRYDNLLESME